MSFNVNRYKEGLSVLTGSSVLGCLLSCFIIHGITKIVGCTFWKVVRSWRTKNKETITGVKRESRSFQKKTRRETGSVSFSQ